MMQLFALATLLLLHYLLTSGGGDFIPRTKLRRAAPLNGYALNQFLFPKHIAMVLRFALRLMRHLADMAKWCRLRLIEKKLKDLGLNLFVFFFHRYNPDIDLSYGYEEWVRRFHPEHPDA